MQTGESGKKAAAAAGSGSPGKSSVQSSPTLSAKEKVDAAVHEYQEGLRRAREQAEAGIKDKDDEQENHSGVPAFLWQRQEASKRALLAAAAAKNEPNLDEKLTTVKKAPLGILAMFAKRNSQKKYIKN